ncbi:hypothetical protein [Micromonospora sp. NPDC126480]|uniref:hypothetical protein n=1 Tax=Micromonospora sp. NPDC126480 TaxID=3155312 RepID=UPI00331909F5
MNRLPSIFLAGLLALAPVLPALHAAPASARPFATAAADTVTAGAAVGSDGVEILSVRGAGPFRVGARLSRLSAAGLIDWVVEPCDGVVHAGVTGEWAGAILLVFRHGRLVEVGTATVPPRSPAGASVGMSFEELEVIYGRRGSMIRNDVGDASAYLVRFGDRVELYTGHPIRSGVGYYAAGRADHVERAFRQGGAC